MECVLPSGSGGDKSKRLMTGIISKLVLHKNYGFIEVPGQRDGIFFHRDELDSDLSFDEQLQFHRVEFDCYRDERTGKSKALRVKAAQ